MSPETEFFLAQLFCSAIILVGLIGLGIAAVKSILEWIEA